MLEQTDRMGWFLLITAGSLLLLLTAILVFWLQIQRWYAGWSNPGLMPGGSVFESPVGRQRPRLITGRCTGCRLCVSICPKHAWKMTRKGRALVNARCDGCEVCVWQCPEEAIEMV